MKPKESSMIHKQPSVLSNKKSDTQPKELEWGLNQEQKEWLLDVLNTNSDNALKVILINGLISKILTQQRTELLEEILSDNNRVIDMSTHESINTSIFVWKEIKKKLLNLLNKKDE